MIAILIAILPSCLDGSGGFDTAGSDEEEPNGTCAEAQGPYEDGLVANGTFSSSEDQDWYLVDLSAGGDVEIRTNDVNGDDCSDADPQIDVYAADCTTYLGGNDDDAEGDTLCSGLVLSAAPGPLHVAVAPCCGVERSARYQVEVVAH